MSTLAVSNPRITVFTKLADDHENTELAYARLKGAEVYAAHAAEEYAPGYRFIDDARECLGSLLDITFSYFIFAESRYLLGLAEFNFKGKMAPEALKHFTDSAEAGNGKAASRLSNYYYSIGDQKQGEWWELVSPPASSNSSPVPEVSSPSVSSASNSDSEAYSSGLKKLSNGGSDFDAAVDFETAANQGNAKASYYLFRIYERQDLNILADAWKPIAAKRVRDAAIFEQQDLELQQMDTILNGPA